MNIYADEKSKLVTTIVLWGFIASITFHLISCLAFGFNSYPRTTFLFSPFDRFNDFFHSRDLNVGLSPYYQKGRIGGSNYYPFGNIIMYLFTLFPRLGSFFIFIGIFILYFVYFITVNLKSISKKLYLREVFILSFLTYPFLFELDRGNCEAITFIFVSLSLYFFLRKRFIISSIFLSLGISMKAYPAVFLLLFVCEKKYKEISYALINTLLLTFISLLLHKGGFKTNLSFIFSGFELSKHLFFGNNNILQRGTSLFMLFKLIFIETGINNIINMSAFLDMYYMGALVIFALLAWYVVFVEKELWKKATILTFSMLILPPVSADYKLLYVFIPLFWFINSKANDKKWLFYSIMLALLLIPKDYYLFPNIISDSGYNDISISMVINIVIMLVILFVIIKDGILWVKFRVKSIP